jgi:hypothetical protein
VAIHQKKSQDRNIITVPTDKHRDLGLFMVFLGVVGTLPADFLFEWLGYDGPESFVAGVSGLMCLLMGLYFIGFSRKTFRIESDAIFVKDGLFEKPVRYAWEESPKLRLRSQEEDRGNVHLEFWLVNLIDGKRQYVLDRRLGNQMESRCLAEAIAKTIRCGVIEKSDHGEILVPLEELDLPFSERARRNPNLLGDIVDTPPVGSSIEKEAHGDTLKFSWPLANSGLVSEFLTIVIIVVLLSVVPIFHARPNLDKPTEEPARFHRSFWDLARQDGNYLFFFVSGATLALAYIGLFGYRKEILACPERLSSTDRLWGVPLNRSVIPSEKLEEIWVRQSSRGTHIQFISDDCIIAGRTSSLETATWLASQVRHY